jgi:hypothetical protein
MRYVVVVLAVLGAAGLLGVGGFALLGTEGLLAPGLTNTAGTARANDETFDMIGYLPKFRAGTIFLVVAGVFGLLAAVLALKGRGKTAAALLLVPLVGPLMPLVVAFTRTTQAPVAVAALLFTLAVTPMGLVFLAGILAFFVRPVPAGGPPLPPRGRPRPRPRDEDDED